MPDDSRLQIRIRDLRRQRSLTQEELADALGISRQSINAMEAGRTLPSLPMALQIAHYFAVPLSSVFIVEDADGIKALVPVADVKPWLAVPLRAPANLWETADAYFLELQVPGFKLEDLTLDVGETTVLVQGKAPSMTTDCQPLFIEFGPKPFVRSVEMPTSIHPERSQAQLHFGVLRLYLPKSGHGNMTRVTIIDG